MKTESQKKPFFARLLEQQRGESQGGRPPQATLKYPSDSDESQTQKFPSDGDEFGA